MNSKVKLILVFSLVLTLLLVFSGGVSAADVNSTTLTDSGNDASVVVSSQVSNVNQSSTLNSENNNFDNSTNLLSTDSESKNVYYQLDEVSTVKGDSSTFNNGNVLGAIQDTKNIYISPNGLSNATGTVNDPTDWETAYTNIEDGGTIYFASGEYTSIINQTISKNITLYHDTTTADAILNAKGTGNMFRNFENNTLNISGLTFVNGTGYMTVLTIYSGNITYGGAIFSNGTLNINKSTFINNTANTGGAVASYKEVTINDSKFFNNRAEHYGGACYFEGIQYISNDIFINNYADVVGGAFGSEGNLTLINSTLINNSAKFNAGGITAYKNSIIINSTFINNSQLDFDTGADGHGGAILSSLNCTILSCTFINNSANKSGGAIYSLVMTGIIKGCVFINNTDSIGVTISIMNAKNVSYDYNWWGNNAPFNGKNLIYQNSTTETSTYVIPNNWVIMNLVKNGTIVTAYLNKISNNESTIGNLPDDIILPSRNVTFSSTTGTFNPITNATDENGESQSTYTSTNDNLNIFAVIDNQTLNINAKMEIPNVTGLPDSTQTLVINVTDINGNPINSGNVTVIINGKNITVPVVNGKAKVNLTLPSTSGEHNVSVIYTDKNIELIDHITLNVTETATVISSENISMTTSDTKNLTIELKTEDGTVLPSENVTFTFNGVEYNKTTDSNGKVYLTVSGLNVGSYQLVYSFAGDKNYTASNGTNTITVYAASSKSTSITNTELVAYENGTVVVYVVDDGSIVNTGSVNIFYNNTAIGTAYVHNGEAVINLTGVKPGTYNVTVFYFGKNPFESASKNMPLTILSDISTILTANTFNHIAFTGNNFTGKLVDVNGNPVIGQHIALNLTRLNNGASKIYWVTTDVNGEFQLQINLCANNYTGKAYYYGNGTYLPSESNLTNITVTKMGTVLTADTFNHTEFTGKNFTGKFVDVNGNPISGQHIALNLTRLSNGASKIYWVTTDVNGEFQLAINLCANNYTGKAYYYGNGTFFPSQSNLTNIIVTKI